MDRSDVDRWLDAYVTAWKRYDRAQIGALFSEDAVYRYHPYDEPLRGRDEVVKSWLGEDEQAGASSRDAEGTYDATYRAVAVDGDAAVATGSSSYRDTPDGPVVRVFDNCFIMRFDEAGRCREFTEWYVERPPRLIVMVLAATLVGAYDLRVEEYPYPTDVEPGAVVLQMLASGICGTDKHTYRGETEQYAGTEHARSTPFPIIQGHENVGVVVELGPGGAAAFDGTALAIGDRVVPAPNRSCGTCRYCVEDFPYYFCRHLENYGNSLTSSRPPHLFGGWSEYLYVLPGTPLFKVPAELPTDVAVLTELFAVTHSLDLAAEMPRPGGFRPGDTVVILGVGPVGLVHAAKAKLRGARQVVAVDRLTARLDIAAALGATDCVLATDDDETVPTIRTLTPGGVDVVVDATGHPDSFGPALAVLRDGGTLLEVGAFVDLGRVPVNPAEILGRSLTIVGVAGEDARSYDSTLRLLAEHQQTVPFDRAVTHRFPIERADEAMQTALGAEDAMKVIIVPGPAPLTPPRRGPAGTPADRVGGGGR